MLGTPVSMPALVAPMAFQQIAHEEGEVAMARGAGDAGTLMCVSTVATATPAEIAAAAPGAPRWLQIYVFRDRGVSDEVIEQALEAGFTALVLTADLPVYGIRHREARTGFEAPEDDVPAIVAARARGGEPEGHHSLGSSRVRPGMGLRHRALRALEGARAREGPRHCGGRDPRV